MTKKKNPSVVDISQYINEPDDVVHYPTFGQPSYYEPWMCEAILEIAAKGGHIPAMCVRIGIKSISVFYEYINKHPEFKEAVAYGKLISQAFYEQQLLKGATGKIEGFNATAFALIMNNKFDNEYKRDRQNGTTEITINNLNLSQDQMDYKIAQKMAALKSMGVDMIGNSGGSSEEEFISPQLAIDGECIEVE